MYYTIKIYSEEEIELCKNVISGFGHDINNELEFKLKKAEYGWDLESQITLLTYRIRDKLQQYRKKTGFHKKWTKEDYFESKEKLVKELTRLDETIAEIELNIDKVRRFKMLSGRIEKLADHIKEINDNGYNKFI